MNLKTSRFGFVSKILYATIFVLIFGVSFLLCSHNAGAVSYSGSSYINSTGCSLVYNNGGSITFNTDNGGCHIGMSGISNISGVRYLAIRFSPDLQIPANSIVAITLKIKTDSSYPQVGWTTKSLGYSLIDSSMGEYGTNYSYFYFSQAISGEIDLFPSTFFGNFSFLDMSVSSISYTTLDYQPTRGQITQLQNTLSEINLNSGTTNANLEIIRDRLGTTNSNLEIIRGKLDDITSNSDRTADAIEEQQQQDEEDRENMENQQNDTSTSASDSQADAEATGTTLLAAFSSFVSALTSAQPSDCNIDMDLGNLDLGVVNLCRLSLPQPFHTIASIMLILFFVPLSISTARKVISLFRSFQ